MSAEATRELAAVGRAYLTEVVAAGKRGLTSTNYAATKRQIEDALGRLATAGVEVPAAERDHLFADLQAQYERAVRAAIAREEQARIREQIRDEQRREREAREAVEQAERERQAIELALNKALSQAAGQHAAEVERLKAQLAAAEAKSARAISLAQITKTGWRRRERRIESARIAECQRPRSVKRPARAARSSAVRDAASLARTATAADGRHSETASDCASSVVRTCEITRVYRGCSTPVGCISLPCKDLPKFSSTVLDSPIGNCFARTKEAPRPTEWSELAKRAGDCRRPL